MTMVHHSDARTITRTAEPQATQALEFTDEQRKMIRETFANGASDSEFAVLMEVARARRLSPLLRQIHFVKRWDSGNRREVWSVQASIDGLRAIAERTGLYDGQDEPEFVEGADGSLLCCKVKVYRKDWTRPVVGVAYWSEYVQTIRDKQTGKEGPGPMWRRMPHVMLAKCAESIALRKAFPEDIGGIYSREEMAQADRDAVSVEGELVSDADVRRPDDKPRTIDDGAAVALAKSIATAQKWTAAVAMLPSDTDPKASAAARALVDRLRKGLATADATGVEQARSVYAALPAWVRYAEPVEFPVVVAETTIDRNHHEGA